MIKIPIIITEKEALKIQALQVGKYITPPSLLNYPAQNLLQEAEPFFDIALKLKEAKTLYSKGISSDEILKKTNWYFDVDGIWKQVLIIPCKKNIATEAIAHKLDNNPEALRDIPLQDFIQSNLLNYLFPKTSGVKIYFEHFKSKTAYALNDSEDKIIYSIDRLQEISCGAKHYDTLFKKVRKNGINLNGIEYIENELITLLIHELNHLLQRVRNPDSTRALDVTTDFVEKIPKLEKDKQTYLKNELARLKTVPLNQTNWKEVFQKTQALTDLLNTQPAEYKEKKDKIFTYVISNREYESYLIQYLYDCLLKPEKPLSEDISDYRKMYSAHLKNYYRINNAKIIPYNFQYNQLSEYISVKQFYPFINSFKNKENAVDFFTKEGVPLNTISKLYEQAHECKKIEDNSILKNELILERIEKYGKEKTTAFYTAYFGKEKANALMLNAEKSFTKKIRQLF